MRNAYKCSQVITPPSHDLLPTKFICSALGWNNLTLRVVLARKLPPKIRGRGAEQYLDCYSSIKIAVLQSCRAMYYNYYYNYYYNIKRSDSSSTFFDDVSSRAMYCRAMY